MALRVVGAGLGRTGTLSLKMALERLLGEPCYHMAEVLQRPAHVALWRRATRGELEDWESIFSTFVAAVDWPASAFWPELAEAYPEALVLLSVRDAEAWWRSASRTIFPATLRGEGEWREMVDGLFATRFTSQLEDREACIEAFESHNERVRRAVPAERLLEWRAAEGWAPLCRALDLPLPDEPFPHVNTTQQFRERRVDEGRRGPRASAEENA